VWLFVIASATALLGVWAYLIMRSPQVRTETKTVLGFFQPLPVSHFGAARVIDGETLEVGGKRIRLYGIDAPELRQTCNDQNNVPYRCGQHASEALGRLIGLQAVHCEKTWMGKYGSIVAICFSSISQNLNDAMLSAGWAVAWSSDDGHYLGLEQAAKEQRLGLWSGSFMWPAEWRRRHKHHKLG
jgi:endonuclease YncB( thermonuclease family)